MGKLEKKKKQETTGETAANVAAADTTKQANKIKDDLDKLVEDIDDILEENAEEFVKNYVQRGGE